MDVIVEYSGSGDEGSGDGELKPPLTPREEAGNQVKLDRAAEICRRVWVHAHTARTLAQQAGGDPEVADRAKQAANGAREAMNLLVAAGATRPQETILPAVVASIALDPFAHLDLGDLLKLSDPDTMADNEVLLALLEEAQAVAERLDLRRGHVVGAHIPLQPGESRGTDLAETISEIAFRLRYEMHGPVGKD